ncbi:vacuolar transporter chaperone 2 [Pyricularia oryzae 70-15]|uniref:Vacuolar transporter chaperone 2 n=1 Tax=Pyricularia oryzae (strain 70-15 / ATCC MYA-4617 / FGSC 8958) TaxID=242507 RepID=G4MTM6_PYRO7|nr:vacuolar transporter chaperone 2 [Pyricularia oryzae 70-15]EHA55584.1 vacuolar transporter chaperone 2 [Pyricularia oryzae 70-15]KAI7919984.1 vacuolar transporter chaperone 2 [Pyricularia oryzae]KAI7927000.1 vacuolar transporter chaperone 2 [Pyricularia oryzae]
MRFGKTLRQSIHQPWKDKYIDYAKLKSILREDNSDEDDQPWTEEDERRFGDELLNNQLEKVARFHEETFTQIRDRVDAAFDKMKQLTPTELGEVGSKNDESEFAGNGKGKEKEKTPAVDKNKIRELETELDRITNDIRALKSYSALNYTGFLKIVKKHDRKRGGRYRIRPMMQARLAITPFNSEVGYAPLLRKLSLMYFAVREHLEEGAGDVPLPLDLQEIQPETLDGERYTAHKFWVHPDNLLEVKTYILRRLPSLVYSQQSSKEVDSSDDPRQSSLYFDNSKFDLYLKKVEQKDEAASLRLRWYGLLSTKPDVFLEQKMVNSSGSSEERRLVVKEKYIKSFLDGEYKMEKTIQKMERQGRSQQEIDDFKSTANTIQEFVLENNLQPLLRANYVRTAFQKPADDRVRISIDTELVFVREDVLDKRHPCRDPDDWHRRDIDNRSVTYPFKDINPSEISRFPYAVLEIKLKEDNTRRRPAWIEDLMASHLVHPVPRFSKFAHGVASLFDDYVNALPFWLSDLETDIRKDPHTAFREEEQRRMERAEDEMVVGSFLGAKVGSFKPRSSPKGGRSYLSERASADAGINPQSSASHPRSYPGPEETRDRQGSADDDATAVEESQKGYGTLSSVLPGFSMTRYARAKREREAGGSLSQLPEGVVEPKEWIKNDGPLKVEAKVWLANERTFLKWQHIAVLLGSLAVGLYTAAAGRSKKHSAEEAHLVAQVIGIAYLGMAAFAAGWGYYTFQSRRQMIVARSGQDFDNIFGPLTVSLGLVVALVLNFVFAYRAALERWDDLAGSNGGVASSINSTYANDELR